MPFERWLSDIDKSHRSQISMESASWGLLYYATGRQNHMDGARRIKRSVGLCYMKTKLWTNYQCIPKILALNVLYCCFLLPSCFPVALESTCFGCVWLLFIFIFISSDWFHCKCKVPISIIDNFWSWNRCIVFKNKWFIRQSQTGDIKTESVWFVWQNRLKKWW